MSPKATDPEKRALQAAIRLLRSRDRTESEVRTHLLSRGFPEAEVEAVLTTLREARYLDDARIAGRAVELATTKPKGRLRLEAELKRRGLEEPTVQEALDRAPTDPELAEQAFWQARKPGDTPARAAARLERLGFDEETVRAVIERHFPEFD